MINKDINWDHEPNWSYLFIFEYNNWKFTIEANDKGITSLYESSYIIDYRGNFREDNVLEKRYKDYLKHFFDGKDVSSVPLDLVGTPFEIKVWEELRKVKPGETASYKDIAERIGNPKAYQAVGNAVGKNPVMLFVPCHRIIKSDGSIGGFSSDPKLKAYLLENKL